ncbi:MAG: peptide chain release factor 1 [Burkholderiaceae bacterium]|nr:peptide chain release factor 1 [Burkholderiaceae bacterium]
MNGSMRAKLEQFERRLGEVNRLLSSQSAARDMAEFRRLNREHAELTQLAGHFQAWKQATRDLAAADSMRDDAGMREFADEEAAAARERIATEHATLQRLLLPRDPDDDRDVILEIRAGTGGDESALFAGDLLRMYLRYAERQRWQTELISESASDLGGYKEVILRIAGSAVYAKLKFESGTHRVQRVPETEAQGRIHTSACTVAVLPEADEAGEVQISNDELRIDVFRASGAGGQHVNKTESAVRITHLPSGIVVECQDDRSQHRNRDKAMKVLAARLKDRQAQQAHAKEAAQRKSLVGSGDRSERIRTYNFPQGRITDHRINLTLYKLDRIIAGELDEVVEALATAQQARQLEALSEELPV